MRVPTRLLWAFLVLPVACSARPRPDATPTPPVPSAAIAPADRGATIAAPTGAVPSAAGNPAPAAPTSRPGPRSVRTPARQPAVAPSVATPAVRASAAPTPSGMATVRPTAPPTVQRLPPNAPPRIDAVSVSATVVHPGDELHGSAVTSSNVASVEVRIGNFSIPLTKVGVGHFTLDYTVANVPFFLYGTYQAVVIARNARGDEATRDLAITIE